MKEYEIQFPDEMRVAVCVSGMPKNFKLGYFFQNANLFTHLNPDIFIHSWYNETPSELDEVLEVYKPKKFQLDKNNQIVLQKAEYRGTSPRYPAYNVFSFFKSIHLCDLLRRDYENAGGFKYDWVIRLRFDYALNRRFYLRYYFNTSMYMPPELVDRNMVTDQFAFSNSQNMETYSNTFLHLDEYYDAGEEMIGEHMLTRHLRENNLLDQIVRVKMNHPFSPLGGDSMENSLIRNKNALRSEVDILPELKDAAMIYKV